ncbi:MAG: YfcC family protein [Planctomycetes bacterium]|nr:YfcC family protein [Planctomycetota bacterium]
MNKPSRFPHSLVLIFAMVVLAQILTYVLPKGKFDKEPMPNKGAPFVELVGQSPLRQRLAAARAARGLGVAEVAALFHVSAGTVTEWEAGAPAADEAWHPGTHIEATVGALVNRWVETGSAPTAAEIESWKKALADQHVHLRVLPGSYAVAEAAAATPWYEPLSAIWKILMAIPKGFAEGAEIIFFVFVVGGVIGILRATGAIDALIGKAIDGFADKPVLLISIMTLLFAIGSSTIGMAEEYMPFIPLLVTLCLALRMDAVVGLGIVYIGAGVGYGCAAINPFTVMIAQDIAGLPPASGWVFRVVYMLVSTAVGVLHIVRYANRIKRDPELSLVRDIDYSKGYEMPADTALTPARVIVMAMFVATIVVIVYGVSEASGWEWYFTELMAVFLGLGILAAVVGRVSPNQVANKFCEGAADMTTTALLIGVARTIQVVLDDGEVIDTVINGIAEAIKGAGSFGASTGMLGVQCVANFFIPSGSGQAYVTMPIMAPLADLTGVSRQTAVLAYQTGDGFMNMIVPTNALLMGMLALARIPFVRWARFVVPLLLQLLVVAVGALVVASWIGY